MATRAKQQSAVVTTTAIALMLSSPVAAQAIPVIGSWVGQLEIGGGATLIVIYHVEAGADGGLTGTLDSPDQLATGIPLSSVTFVDGVLAVVSTAIPGEPTFRGTLSADGNSITGTFTQGGGSLPLELTRREDPA